MQSDLCECEATRSLPGCLPCHSPTGCLIVNTHLREFYVVFHFQVRSRALLVPGLRASRAGETTPWTQFLSSLCTMSTISFFSQQTPQMVSTLVKVVSFIRNFPGTAIYKVLAEHKKGHLLSFQKTNAEEEIFRVAKMTGIVTLAGNLVERTTHKVHVLVAGAGSKHVSMVTLFINVVPPLTTMKQPPSLVVAVNPDEIPKVVKAGSKPQEGHLWKIVYGNTEKVLLRCPSPNLFLGVEHLFLGVEYKGENWRGYPPSHSLLRCPRSLCWHLCKGQKACYDTSENHAQHDRKGLFQSYRIEPSKMRIVIGNYRKRSSNM